MLLKLGYQVRTADSGSAALDYLQREAFDAVLLDCQLPPLNGMSVSSQIRTLAGCAELSVFMIALSIDREHCTGASFIDYLSKPVKFEDLQAALQRRVLGFEQGESAAN
jgi:CheY-like chemotaxis protein